MSWGDLPVWAQYLTQGLLLSVLLCFSAVVLARAGRSPYWALLALVPFAFVVGLWFIAYSKWPQQNAP